MALVSAHRGGPGSAGAPGNSIAAFENAVRLGCDLIEFDVRHLPDATAYVAHDVTADHDVLTLLDVLDVIRGHAMAHVDLKDQGFEAATVSRIVTELGVSNVVITSAEDSSVRAVVAWADKHAPGLLVGLSSARRSWAGPRWARGWTAVEAAFARTRIRRSGANVVVAHHRLAHWSLRRYAKRRSLRLLVWTVDNPDELASWVNDPHTWAVTTNVPHLALAVRK